MISRMKIAGICLLMFMTASAVYAQDAGTGEPKPVDISGQVYFNWHTGMTDSTDNESGDKKNTFEFERVYLNWKKTFDDTFSARVTLDIGNEEVIEEAEINDDGTVDGKVTSKYRVYAKYAYLQVKKEAGPLDLALKFGLIDTPVLGYVDKLSDQRWLHKNLLDDAKNLLPDGSSIDNSADVGASLSLKFMKSELALALTNGEGYKKTNESLYDDDSDASKNSAYGKAFYTRLSIVPLKSLYINGYFRQEGTSTNFSDSNKGYYGAGVAWKDELVMAGLNYIMPFQSIEGEEAAWPNGDEKKMTLAEFWVTFTPEKLIGMPLLASVRYGWGEDSDQDDSKTTFMGVGLGYEFTDYFRTMAWYQQYDSEAADTAELPNPEKTFYIKTEFSF